MSAAKIHGAENPLRKIFSNDFIFRIPLYQRPYSWGEEQAGALLDDILAFVDPDPAVNLEDLTPYFLGSVVLIKAEERPDAEVVDGQQRLTTLTILLAVLRYMIQNEDYSNALTKYLYQEGNLLEGNPNRYRLTLRDRDAEFFRLYIQDPGGLARLSEIDSVSLKDSQKLIKGNAELFQERLRRVANHIRIRLAQFLVRNCLMVVVSTPDFDAAYRIFSILNDRGLDLSHTDILKSEVIGRISVDRQSSFNKLWEDAEELLGRDSFADLFAHIRMIFRKQKMRESILKEFREYVVRPIESPLKIINEVVVPYADALCVIKTSGYQSAEAPERVNEYLHWLGRIDNTDWIPPALLFFVGNQNRPKIMARFFSDLERLAAFMMMTRYGINQRLERYGRLLAEIDSNLDLFRVDSPLQLTIPEQRHFLREMNGDVYLQSVPRRTYLLLRLNSALSDGSAHYDHKVLSIEHVLPQSPAADSQWFRWFPTEEMRATWLHRLANLALLTHSKNSSASNFEFDRKKNLYFARNGISPFPLTTQVLVEPEWTIEVLQRLQMTRLESLMRLWRIDADLDEIIRGYTDPDEVETAVEPEMEMPVIRAKFHDEVVAVVERYLRCNLKKRRQSIWSTADREIAVACLVSKRYLDRRPSFWFSLQKGTQVQLAAAKTAFCAFGLGNSKKVVILPYTKMEPLFEKLGATLDAEGAIEKWHIEFEITDLGRIDLILRGGKGVVDVSQYRHGQDTAD
jgi:hypothetical protein